MSESLFSAIGDAAYTPQPNPLYGAHYVTPEDYTKYAPQGATPPTQPIWIDTQGNDITSKMSAIPPEHQQTLAATPYVQPGFWSKLFSPNARNITMQDAAAQAYPGQQSQELQSRIQGLIGSAQAETGNLIGRANAFENTSIPTQAGLAGIGAMNPDALNQFYRNQAGLTAGTYPAEANAATAIANKTAAGAPAAANPNISSAATTQAAVNAKLAPLIGQNALWQAAYGDPMQQYRNYQDAANITLAGGNPRILHMNPDGSSSVMPNPTTSYQNQMMQGLLGNTSGSVTGIAGAYGLPLRPQSSPFSVPGTQSSQPSTQQQAPFTPPPKEDTGVQRGITPIPGTDYSIDQDGNAFYKDGTFVPPENYKDQPLGKVISHAIGLKKAIEVHKREPLLPHGLGFEAKQLGTQTLHNTPQYWIGRGLGAAYHGLIGE